MEILTGIATVPKGTGLTEQSVTFLLILIQNTYLTASILKMSYQTWKVSSSRLETMLVFIYLHMGEIWKCIFPPPPINTLYLFDGALLQMLLHCFLDEKLLLVELHPRVIFHNKFQDGLVWNPRPVITRLQRKRTRKISRFLFLNKKKEQAHGTVLRGWFTKFVHTSIASMRISSTLCWVPAKLVTGTFLLAATLAHAGIVLFTFLTLAFSYL